MQKTSKAKPIPPTLSNSLTVKAGPTGMAESAKTKPKYDRNLRK